VLTYQTSIIGLIKDRYKKLLFYILNMEDKEQLKKVFEFAFEILETIEKDHAEWEEE